MIIAANHKIHAGENTIRKRATSRSIAVAYRNGQETDKLIVDAQVHIWSQGTRSGQYRQISSYSAEVRLKEMDEGGVDAALLHPPDLGLVMGRAVCDWIGWKLLG